MHISYFFVPNFTKDLDLAGGFFTTLCRNKKHLLRDLMLQIHISMTAAPKNDRSSEGSQLD